jgi:hypothetical protein
MRSTQRGPSAVARKSRRDKPNLMTQSKNFASLLLKFSNRSNGTDDGCGAVLDLQFLQNIRDVLLHRAWAQMQNRGDFGIAFAFDHPLEHLILAPAELRQWLKTGTGCLRFPFVVVNDLVDPLFEFQRQLWDSFAIPLHHRFKCVQQLLGGGHFHFNLMLVHVVSVEVFGALRPVAPRYINLASIQQLLEHRLQQGFIVHDVALALTQGSFVGEHLALGAVVGVVGEGVDFDFNVSFRGLVSGFVVEGDLSAFALECEAGLHGGTTSRSAGVTADSKLP